VSEPLKDDIFHAISDNKYRWRSTEHTKSILGWRPTGRSDDHPLPQTPGTVVPAAGPTSPYLDLSRAGGLQPFTGIKCSF